MQRDGVHSCVLPGKRWGAGSPTSRLYGLDTPRTISGVARPFIRGPAFVVRRGVFSGRQYRLRRPERCGSLGAEGHTLPAVRAAIGQPLGSMVKRRAYVPH